MVQYTPGQADRQYRRDRRYVTLFAYNGWKMRCWPCETCGGPLDAQGDCTESVCPESVYMQ